MFFYLLMRDLGFSRAGGLVSAVVFSFSGYMISVINLITTLASAVWFPLVFLFYNRMLKGRAFVNLIAVSVLLGFMFLGGEPTPLYATLFLLGLYTLMVSAPARQKLPGNILLYASCIGLFALICSFQIVPLAELIGLSDRTLSSFERATMWSFHPRSVVDFLLPFFYGPLHFQPDTPLRQDWLILSYMGVVPLVLFLIALIFCKGRRPAFFKIGFAMGLIFIFGRFTPVYKILYRYAPGFTFIRYPVKFFFVSVVSFVFLCGAGFDEYLRRVKGGDPRFLKFVKGVFVTSFTGAILFLALYILRDRILFFARAYSEKLGSAGDGAPLKYYTIFFTDFFNFRRMLVFFILAALAMFVGSEKTRRPAALSAVIIGLIFVDLYGGKSIEVNPTASRQDLRASTPNIRALEADKGLFRVYTSYKQSKAHESLKGDSYEDAMRKSKDSLCPNKPMEHGIYSARGYLSVRNADYTKIILLADTSPLPSSTNILNMLNVKYVVTPEEIDDPACEFINKGSSYLYLNKDALDRAYLVPGYVVLESEEEIASKMRSKTFRPDREVILEEEPELVHRPSSIVHRKEYVDILRYEPNEVIIEANVRKKAKFLVLADNYYPGWEAEADGEKTKVYKANFVLRAVYLSPGRHTVRFFYNPVSFKIGAAISLVTLIILTGTGIFLYIKKMQNQLEKPGQGRYT